MNVRKHLWIVHFKLIRPAECLFEPHNEQAHWMRAARKWIICRRNYSIEMNGKTQNTPEISAHATYVSKQCRQVSQSILFSGFQKFCRLDVRVCYLYRVEHTNCVVSCTPKMFTLRDSMFNSLKQCERNNGKEAEQLNESQHIVREL